jgi:hypothetical protein
MVSYSTSTSQVLKSKMKPLFIFTFSGIKFMNHELGLRDTHIVKLYNTYNFFSEQKI